jgi:hypothetical protein
MNPAAKRCMRTIQVVIDNELHAALIAQAKEQRLSLGDHLRAVLVLAGKVQPKSDTIKEVVS